MHAKHIFRHVIYVLKMILIRYTTQIQKYQDSDNKTISGVFQRRDRVYQCKEGLNKTQTELL